MGSLSAGTAQRLGALSAQEQQEFEPLGTAIDRALQAGFRGISAEWDHREGRRGAGRLLAARTLDDGSRAVIAFYSPDWVEAFCVGPEPAPLVPPGGHAQLVGDPGEVVDLVLAGHWAAYAQDDPPVGA